MKDKREKCKRNVLNNEALANPQEEMNVQVGATDYGNLKPVSAVGISDRIGCSRSPLSIAIW